MNNLNIFKYSKEKWLAIVAKGEMRFILTTGVLKLGIFFSLFYIVIRNLQYSKFDLNGVVFKTILLNFILTLPISIIVGSIVAKFIWDKNNRKFLDK
jgi:ABC-type uncharacterized transport system permease subunit